MPSSGASVMFTPTKPFPSEGICRQIWVLSPGIPRDPRRGFPYFGPDNESGSSGSLVRAGHCGIGVGHPGFWAAGGWRGPHTGIAGDPGADNGGDGALGLALLAQPTATTAVAADLLGCHCLCRLCCHSVFDG